jgi:hypothetical protein
MKSIQKDCGNIADNAPNELKNSYKRLSVIAVGFISNFIVIV